MKRRLLTTGEMASGSESTLRTVRFYEDVGLIRPVSRTPGGHRKFDPRELERLRAILGFREAGLTVDEIRNLMELKSRCESPEQAVAGLGNALGERAKALERKINLLKRVHRELGETLQFIEHCRGCTHGPFPECCDRCDLNTSDRCPRPAQLLWGAGPKACSLDE